MNQSQEQKYVCYRSICSKRRIKEIPEDVQILQLFWEHDFNDYIDTIDVYSLPEEEKAKLGVVTDWTFLAKYTNLLSLYIYIEGENENILPCLENRDVNLPISLRQLIIEGAIEYEFKDLSFLKRLENLEYLYLGESLNLTEKALEYLPGKLETLCLYMFLDKAYFSEERNMNLQDKINILKKILEKYNIKNLILFEDFPNALKDVLCEKLNIKNIRKYNPNLEKVHWLILDMFPEVEDYYY